MQEARVRAATPAGPVAPRPSLPRRGEVIDMRRSRAVVLLLLTVLVLALAAPASSAEAPRSFFHGVFFPAGMEGTGTECPYTWSEMPPACVIDPGTQTVLGNGRVLLLDQETYWISLAYRRDGTVEPRKTGYAVIVGYGVLDATATGPTWGTWIHYSFGADPEDPADDVASFSGAFIGRFENGVPKVRIFGEGLGIYENELMFGRILRVADPWNMYGFVVDPDLL